MCGCGVVWFGGGGGGGGEVGGEAGQGVRIVCGGGMEAWGGGWGAGGQYFQYFAAQCDSLASRHPECCLAPEQRLCHAGMQAHSLHACGALRMERILFRDMDDEPQYRNSSPTHPTPSLRHRTRYKPHGLYVGGCAE